MILSLRLDIMMFEEEQQLEVNFLKCKICQKEFPRFDQRGFRNAGFTAHQNRCIEREYLLNNPVVDHQSSPTQRFLLPAPLAVSPSSSYSSTTHRAIIARSNSSSPVSQQQQQHAQQQRHYQHQYTLQQQMENTHYQSIDMSDFSAPHSTSGIHYVSEDANSSILQPLHQQDNHLSSYITGYNEQLPLQHQQEEILDYSLFSRVNYYSLYSHSPHTTSTVSHTTTLVHNNEMPASIHDELIFPITHCNYCEPEYGLHQSTCLYLAAFLRQSGSIM